MSESYDIHALNCHTDAAVHPCMKRHADSIFNLGEGSIISGGAEHNHVVRSSAESELNGTDERMRTIT